MVGDAALEIDGWGCSGAEVHRDRVVAHQPRRHGAVPGVPVVADRIDHAARPFEVQRRQFVLALQSSGLASGDQRLEQLAEQLVIAEARAFLVGARQQQVKAFDLLQRDRFVVVGFVGHQRPAEVGVEFVGHAGVLQEPTDTWRLTGEHLAREIAGDGLGVAGDLCRPCSRIVGSQQRQRSHLHSGRPAFGATVQRGEVECFGIDTESGGERPGLAEVEAKRRIANLAHRPVEAESMEADGRIAATAKDEPNALQPALQQMLELLRCVDGHEVEVVDHQPNPSSEAMVVVEQRFQRVGGDAAIERNEVVGFGAEPGLHLLQGANAAAPEPCRVGVARIGRHPCDAAVVGRQVPLGEQRGLAAAGCAHDERQWEVVGGVDGGDETGA